MSSRRRRACLLKLEDPIGTAISNHFYSNMAVVLKPLPTLCVYRATNEETRINEKKKLFERISVWKQNWIVFEKKIVLITDQPWPTELQCWKCGVNHSFVMQMNGNWCSVSQLYILADQFPAVIPLCSSWQKTSTGYTREPKGWLPFPGKSLFSFDYRGKKHSLIWLQSQL